MPACLECDQLDKKVNKCMAAHKYKPLRNCITPIIESYHRKIKKGDSVLEIGCGAWSPTKEYCNSIGATWEGIDVLEEYMGKKTIATKIASVEEIPFDNNHFDYVIANQSLEHWEENFVSLRKGLSEVFRVLKPFGWALMNVPIYFHGGFLFVSGKIDEIRNLFEPFSETVIVEEWRNPSHPLPAVKNLTNFYWYNNKLKNKEAYVLDIQASKTPDPPYFDDGPLTPTGKLYRGIIEKGILYYPSVLTYKVLRSLKLLS